MRCVIPSEKCVKCTDKLEILHYICADFDDTISVTGILPVNQKKNGGNVQTKEMKALGSKVRQNLLSYLETREVYELANSDEMSKELQEKIRQGQKIVENLNQPKWSNINEQEMLEKFSFLE